MGSIPGYENSMWNIIKDVGGGKLLCRCDCGTEKLVNKYTVLHGKTLSCGCTQKMFKPLKGMKFGLWEVLEDVNNQYAICKCECGTIKKVQKAHLKNGSSKSCGCKHPGALKDITGQKFNYLTVIEELGNNKILCQCECGDIKEYFKDQVKAGRVKSCGCKSSELKAKALFKDLTGQQFGEWSVLEELGNAIVKVECSCGEVRNINKSTLLNGTSKSCGHATNEFKDLTGQKFSYLTIIEELGYGRVKCQCDCGNITIVQKATLLSGASKSCGCKKTELFINTMLSKHREVSTHKVNNPRTEEQLSAIQSRDNLVEFIQSKYNEIKPTMLELSKELGVNEASTGRIIKRYNLYDYIDFQPIKSQYEKELYDYVSSICNCEIKHSDRSILDGKELDIYIPEKKLALEFNGDYWHSTIFKDKKYHQNKTFDCARKGVQLIHIFQHEYRNNPDKIKSYLKQIILDNKQKIYARDTEVRDITTSEAREFCELYHLQGWSNAKISLGCYYNEELIAVMTFSTPRFNTNYQYELVRYCVKDDISIMGGASKLISHFKNEYKPTSIITYSDISKFTGNVYTRIGFNVEDITEPNYVWVSADLKDVLSRYQTQKHKLLEMGIGTEDETEDDIMSDLNYFKVYDSGNIRLSWIA